MMSRARSRREGGTQKTNDAASWRIDAVYPWVAGFATALELFPELWRLTRKN